MKVLGYVRMSTEKQAASPEVQRAAIKDYVTRYECELVDILEDEAMSGNDGQRPGFLALRKRLTAGEADAVVVYKIDRLSRNLLDLLTFRNECVAGSKRLVSVSEGNIDILTPFGRFMFLLMAALAELEREQIVERTKTTLKHKKERGERTGQVPIGFMVGPDGKTLLPNELERKGMRFAVRLKDKGFALRKISKVLAKKGYLSRKGRPFNPEQVKRLITAAGLLGEPDAPGTAIEPGDEP